MKAREIFGSDSYVIGVLHFSPMIGYVGFEGIESVLKKALRDLEAFEKGGVDGVILENNYDLPHKIIVGHETVAMMTLLVLELKKHTVLPLGVDVLWNDYEAALSIAKIADLKFIRVPVFVDNVQTEFGDILGEAQRVISYRRKICAESIALFTDIQVKHAEMLSSQKPLSRSAREAIDNGSDALIVTGKWTGDAPNIGDLDEVKKVADSFPIIVGSGATKENISVLLSFVNGVIVSTSLKTGKCLEAEQNRNLKPYQETVDENKVRDFMKAFNDTLLRRKLT